MSGLSNEGRVAAAAARSAVSDGRDVGPNTVAALLIELDRLSEEPEPPLPIAGLYRLTTVQREALRSMLEEWANDGFETPPYSAAQYDIFEALGVQSRYYDTKRPG